MTFKSCLTIINALVISKLNFCCSLFYGIPTSQIKKLQKVQNFAARVITKSNRFQPATPILQQLRWLPIKNFIDYRILTITYQTIITKTAPIYLQELLIPYTTSRP